MSERLRRLERSNLYLITRAHPEAGPLGEFLAAVLDAGVDIVQLREKEMEAKQLLEFCEIVRSRTQEADALFIVNDRVDVAIASGADGVHLGQDDLPPKTARAQTGRDFLIGLSTHAKDEVLASNEDEADYIGVGPVFETPTKPGRPATGLELVRFAKDNARKPFFAIGGVDLETLSEVVEAGATRVSVLRVLTQSNDPAGVTKRIKQILENV